MPAFVIFTCETEQQGEGMEMQGIPSKNHGIPHFVGISKMAEGCCYFYKGIRHWYLQNAACANFAKEKSKAGDGGKVLKENVTIIRHVIYRAAATDASPKAP